MAENPLRKAIQSAIRANGTLGSLFGRLGTSEHPNGFILTAYRNARRAMVTALKERNQLQAVNEVLSGLRVTLDAGLRAAIMAGIAAGVEEAGRQVGYYGIESNAQPEDVTRTSANDVDAAIASVLAIVGQQEAFIRSVIATGSDETLILGDEERMGTLGPAPVIRSGTFWVGNLMWSGFERFAGLATVRDDAFKKQCIAALDNRTTDCCLRSHAQIQPMNKPFHLTGTPRFADYVDYPPFHGYCRTAVVLYNPAFEDGITSEMRDGADQFLSERAAGGHPNRRPADAYA